MHVTTQITFIHDSLSNLNKVNMMASLPNNISIELDFRKSHNHILNDNKILSQVATIHVISHHLQNREHQDKEHIYFKFHITIIKY